MDQYDMIQFQKDLISLRIDLSQNQLEQLLIYYEMLRDWNEKMNLTAITDYEEVLKKHFIDSLSLVKVKKIAKLGKITENYSLIDVGTGAGFPGLVLKIAFPKWKVTLVDSLQKRIRFLDAVIERLQLQNVNTVHGRAEDLARPDQLREKYDLCVSRAVANLSTLTEYCIPFVKQGGYFVSYKSEKAEEEIENAGTAIRILGGKLEDKLKFQLPDSDLERCLVVIRKEKTTPLKYPRKAGLPSREPIV